MPYNKDKKFDFALVTVAELLAYAQVNGMLYDLELPDWATGGTNVERLYEALQYLGNGAWLEGVYLGLGAQESADQWLLDLLQNKPVPTKEEAKRIRAKHGRDEAEKENTPRTPATPRTSTPPTQVDVRALIARTRPSSTPLPPANGAAAKKSAAKKVPAKTPVGKNAVAKKAATKPRMRSPKAP